MNNIFDTHAHYSSRQFDADRAELLTRCPRAAWSVCWNVPRIPAMLRRFGAGARRALLPRRAGHPPESLIEEDAATVAVTTGTGVPSWPPCARCLGQGRCGGGGDGLTITGLCRGRSSTTCLKHNCSLPGASTCPCRSMTARPTPKCNELLRKYKPCGALHCYSGSADDAAWLVEQGMYRALAAL